MAEKVWKQVMAMVRLSIFSKNSWTNFFMAVIAVFADSGLLSYKEKQDHKNIETALCQDP